MGFIPMVPTPYTDFIRFLDPREILLTYDTPLLLYHKIGFPTDGAYLLVVGSELGYPLGVGYLHVFRPRIWRISFDAELYS